MGETAAGKPRILMVDDDADFQTIVRGWLAPRYEHLALPGGEGLIERMLAVDPDLVILDVRLPGSSGFELCTRIRADRRFEGLPVLFLTGSREHGDFASRVMFGGTAFLSKPVARKRLLSVLQELLPDEHESIGTGD